MKKLSLLAVVLAAIAAALTLLAPNPSTEPLPEISAPKVTKKGSSHVQSPNVQAPLLPRRVRVSELVRALRIAVESDEREKMSAAFLSLVQHANEFPEEFEALAAAIANDPVLALKLGLLIELAQDTSIEGANALMARVALLLVQTNKSPDVRLAALCALSKGELSADALKLVSALCQKDENIQVRTTAIATISEWMSQLADSAVDPARIGSVSAAHDYLCDQLISLTAMTVNEELRAQAVQVLAMRNPQLPDKIRTTLLNYLETDPSPQARMLVASALGNQTETARAFAFHQLKLAYNTAELDLKRNILFEMVRIGDRQTLDWIAELPAGEPILSQDAQDYLALLQSGRTDPAEIQEIKASWDAERSGETKE